MDPSCPGRYASRHHGPPPRPAGLGLIFAASLTGALVASSCESPTDAAQGQGERVPIGQPVEGQLSGGIVLRYSFDAADGGEYTLFLGAQDGSVLAEVIDPTVGYPITTISATSSGLPFELNAAPVFQAPEDRVYMVHVRAVPPDATASFRVQVYRINRAPENRAAAFAIGDTVSGEVLDPVVDIDRFVAAGATGEEVVVVLEALAPAGSGILALGVTNPLTRDVVGIALASPGVAAPAATGLVHFSSDQDYEFSFQALPTSGGQRYRGPYRFWSYPIDRAPEQLPAVAPTGAEVAGESIAPAGDVDEFSFTGAVGDELVAFLQAPGAFVLEIVPPSGTPIAGVTAAAGNPNLYSHASGRFTLSEAGSYTLRVMGASGTVTSDTGGYRFLLAPVDRRPETLVQMITPGDTVSGEAIDLPGDVDEFTFVAAAGEEFNAFLQGTNGAAATQLLLEVVDADGSPLGAVLSAGSDTSLLSQVTGRFAVQSTGTHRLGVRGTYEFGPRDVGPYRLLLYHVNRAPESLPVTVALGDSVVGEAIDAPGDVDEFQFTVTDTTGAFILLAIEPETANGTALALDIIRAGQLVGQTSTYAPGVSAYVPRLRLGPGAYTVRVDGSRYTQRSLLRGPYRWWWYAFGFGPEVAPDTIAIGDTVTTETIEPLGDADLFHFYGSRGQHLNVALQGLGQQSSGAFDAWLYSPGTGTPPAVLVASPTAAAALGDHQSLRLDLPFTGWYRLSVAGGGGSGALQELGGYRLALEPVSAAPEQAGAALVPGDSVVEEVIDELGDWDEYTVSAMPGQDLGVSIAGGLNPPFAHVLIFDPGSGDSLAAAVGQLERLAGPFTVPPSGTVAVAVREPANYTRFCYNVTCNDIYRFTGPYTLRVVAIDRAPESVPATYTRPDTVRGEAVAPKWDIDEFVAFGTQGERLAVYWHLTEDPVPPGSAITLEVVDPASGTVLAGSGASQTGATQQFNHQGAFNVPAGGSYLIRVRGYDVLEPGKGTAPYEFYLAPEP